MTRAALAPRTERLARRSAWLWRARMEDGPADLGGPPLGVARLAEAGEIGLADRAVERDRRFGDVGGEGAVGPVDVVVGAVVERSRPAPRRGSRGRGTLTDVVDRCGDGDEHGPWSRARGRTRRCRRGRRPLPRVPTRDAASVASSSPNAPRNQGPNSSASTMAVIAAARVGATLRSSIDGGVDEPSRSRNERTAVWVVLSTRSRRSRWLVMTWLRASRSSVPTTSAISSSGMPRSRKRRMMCAVEICPVA